MKKTLVLIIAAFLSVIETFATQAYPHLISFTQPNKSTLSIYIKGDEKINWIESEDGYSLLHDDDGYLVYAIQDKNGNMIPSTIIAHDKKYRTAGEDSILAKIPKYLRYTDDQIRDLLSLWEILEDQKSQKSNITTTGEVKLLLILMQFTDKQFTRTTQEIRKLFNQANYTAGGLTGSVHDYYYSNSYGKLSLEFDIAGPYTTQNATAYYGNRGTNGYQAFAREAVNAAAADVDYSDYDNNGDGVMDGLHILFAGHGEEASGNAAHIWSHKSTLSNLVHDGIAITTYSCSPELRNTSTQLTHIGVICHELGHVFGAPDFYDIDYDGSGGQYPGTGEWDLMGSGNWNDNGKTPAHHNPYTKIFIYEWADVIDLDTTACSVVMEGSSISESSFYRYYTTTPNEFFLLENRQLRNFDSRVPGRGLIIYHVHPSMTPNTDAVNIRHPQKFYPVCASVSTKVPTSSASTYGSINSSGCPFPGARNKTVFDDNSKPASVSWAGNNTEKPITNIKDNPSLRTISFCFNGGSINADKFTASIETTTSVKLSWLPYGNLPVVIAYSTDSIFGTPTNAEHTGGETLEGGGTVIYAGDATNFTHQELEPEQTYYYKIFTRIDNTPNWSTGIMISATTPCQTINAFPYHESFENGGIPHCWQTTSADDSISWSIETGDNVPPIDGTHCLYTHLTDYESVNKTVLLTTSPFDLSELNQANLSFWYSLRTRYAKQDSLTVLYKNSFAGEWKVLKTYSTNAQSWTKDTISLPEKSDFYQLAFKATLNYGKGITLDNIIVFADSEYVDIKTIDNNTPDITLYPNPAKNQTFVNIGNTNANNIIYTIYDLSGRKIKTQIIEGCGIHPINIDGMKAGTYLIQFQSDIFEKTELLIIK